MACSNPSLCAEAAALGRDHLGLSDSGALAPSAADAADALGRWNMDVNDCSYKVTYLKRHDEINLQRCHENS